VLLAHGRSRRGKSENFTSWLATGTARIVARFPATDEVLVASGVWSEERVLRKLFFIQQASNLEVFSAGQELND
jgi:hypothetical protein